MKKQIFSTLIIMGSLFSTSCSSNQIYSLSQPDSGTTNSVRVIKSSIKGATSFSELVFASKDYEVNILPSQKLLDFSNPTGQDVNINLVFNADTEIILAENAYQVYQTSSETVAINLNQDLSRAYADFTNSNYDITFKVNNKIVAKYLKSTKLLKCYSGNCTNKKTNELREGLI